MQELPLNPQNKSGGYSNDDLNGSFILVRKGVEKPQKDGLEPPMLVRNVRPGQNKDDDDMAKKMLLHKETVHRILSHSGKSHGKGGQPPIVKANINTGAIALVCAAGVCQQFVGAAALTSAPDFASLVALFDIVRVTGFTLGYSPIAPTQVTAVGTQPIHQPLWISGDPDAVGAVSFLTLLGSRLLTEKQNLFTNTSKVIKYSYRFPTDKKVVTVAAGVLNSAFGVWTDAAATAVNLCHGGLQIAAASSGGNAALGYGFMQVTFHCEWSNRL